MCWKSKEVPVRQVADKDIKVKKILKKCDDGQLVSPIYCDFPWKIGEVAHCELGEPYASYLNSFSPFKYEEKSKCYDINCGLNSCVFIGWNFNTWISLYEGRGHEMFASNDDEAVCDAIIPAGSSYYLNEHGEYISDKLMITGVSKGTKVYLR